jgi:hypothetical protein
VIQGSVFTGHKLRNVIRGTDEPIREVLAARSPCGYGRQ